MEGRIRLDFPLTDSKGVQGQQEETTSGSGSSAAASLFDSAANKQLKEIQGKCKNDLLEICNTIASEKKITVSSLINMQAIMAMAEKLPVSEEEMLNIPHVTKANFEKVCKQLLPVTQHYAAIRMSIMIDMDEKEAAAAVNKHNDSTDWGQLARSSTTSTPSRAGGKRKRGWTTVLPSQFKRGGGGRRKATPKKRATGARYKRGRSQATPARGSSGTTTRRAPAGSNLMPVPGPSTTRW